MLLEHAGDAYIEAHEKLETLYGQRRMLEREFQNEAGGVQETYPELAEALQSYSAEQVRVFDALNPKLPGVTEIREKMLTKMRNLLAEHRQHVAHKIYDEIPGTVERIATMFTKSSGLPVDYESELIDARFKERGKEAAEQRNVENPHYPERPLAAFAAARRAAKEGYEVALIVGPEGFAYEPYFQDVGIATVAVNIPESKPDEPRSFKAFDDLSALHGKKVLVVEDDVRTGATLQKVLEQIEGHHPGRLGLYLGQTEYRQQIENIPEVFTQTHLAEATPEAAAEFEEYLRSRNLRLFKNV